MPDIGSSAIRFVFRVEFCVPGLVVIATDLECQGMSFHSDGKKPRMKRSMKAIPSNISTAGCRAIPSHIRVLRLSMRRFSKINPSRSNGYLSLYEALVVCRA